MTTSHPTAATVSSDRLDSVTAVAARAAGGVDREGRFPIEAFTELRAQRLLSAPVSVEHGGEGLPLAEVCRVTRALGRACGSTGLVYAMHAGQVLCLDRHVGDDAPAELHELRRQVVDEELLVASCTTEAATGGDVSRSSCHVERHGDRVTLDKNAPVISYAEQADVVMVTARRDGEAVPTDQVLVACPRADLQLSRTQVWDTMGFRGTESHGYRLGATTSAGHVLPVPYGQVSAHTMLPLSHLLWAAAWLGIADAARDKARASVQKAARRNRGEVGGPAALRLAELNLRWEQMSALVERALGTVEEAMADPTRAERAAYLLSVNALKVATSELVADIVGDALRIVGIAGYRRDGEGSLDRIVRDGLGAPLMVNNDRILANNASLVLMDRGGL